MKFRFLDCFAGLGGASEGFAKEEFECLGIEIEPKIAKLYPYDVIVADMKTLDGKNFKGFDVIWGSPPCRDFSILGKMCGKKWKIPPDPERGLILVNAFLKFVKDAEPTFWYMENVWRVREFIELKPRATVYFNKGKRHCLWGNFPATLIPCVNKVFYTKKSPSGFRSSIYNCDKLRSWKIAKIPLPCSQAFAQACKEALMKS